MATYYKMMMLISLSLGAGYLLTGDKLTAILAITVANFCYVCHLEKKWTNSNTA
jgi:hypothetical protein